MSSVSDPLLPIVPMTPLPSPDSRHPSTPAQAAARIDWSTGKVIGFSVPATAHLAADVVRLCLDGRQVATAVANLSVFDLARPLAGLPLPSKEFCAFELSVPEAGLLPGDLARASVLLSLHSADSGQVFFEQALNGPHELLHVTEGAPLDWLFDVTFRGFHGGAVHGVVVDRHGSGIRPQIQARLNDDMAEGVNFHESSADGRVHHFQVRLRAERLQGGSNTLTLSTPHGQPLASFPIQLGPAAGGDSDRRIQALEAQVAFMKHLLLTQEREGLAARLALLKSEVVGIVSEMLSLQRIQLERELLGSPIQIEAAVTPDGTNRPAT